MTDRALRRLSTVIANVAAMLFGCGGAWAVHFQLPWAVLVAVVAGTVGWFAGALAARPLTAVLSAHRTDALGAPAYRLHRLPVEEVAAGGKARNLAAMLRAGHLVPPGWVLLPRAFDGAKLGDEAAAWLAGELRRVGGDQLFAVRSSALAEDSTTASFAGAYDSLLNVPAAEVLAAIQKVRGSRDNGRVAAYAAATGAGEAGDLAVVVQQMVAAEYAGVLFTVHPLTRDLATMMGNVVVGLGEGLVSGTETGSEFTLSRPSGRFDGPDELRPYARQLHDQGHRIEGTFGGVPQDIEWAVADGRLWIVQARPITTLAVSTGATGERNDSLGGNCLWSATNLSEANPQAQTPLTVSYMTFLQNNGGPSMQMRGREMAGYIGGRPYANLSVQITARRGRNERKDPRQVYRAMAGWWGALPDSMPITLIPMTRDDWTDSGLIMLGTLLKMVAKRRRLASYLDEHPARCAELTAQIGAAGTPRALRELWDEELLAHALDAFWMTIATGSELPVTVEAWLREQYQPEVVAALMGNLSGLAGRLESLGPSVGLQEVRAGRLDRAEYLRRFGHRGVNETELAWPRPCEDPQWLERALRETDGGADLEGAGERQREAYRKALATVADGDAAAARRIDRRLRRAARAAAGREAARSEGVRTTAVVRSFALRAAALIGLNEQDVFLLTIEELLAALDGDRTAFELIELRRATYQRYRALPPLPGVIYGAFDPFAWAADVDRRTDYWVAGAEPTPIEMDVDAVVRGYPGAIGTVQGVVRRLDTLDQSDELEPGEILVTHLTNIGWTPLFARAGAVVTDLGAPLSHAAIVARELGIPAVVGCGDATDRLRNGDQVVVDGARGEVRLVAAAAKAGEPEHAAQE